MFDHCIYFNVSTLSRKVTKLWQDEFAKLGLSPSHGYLLAAIASKEAASQKELSEIMELDASTITRFTEQLMHKGFVQRDRIGKGASYSLTSEGQSIVNEINQVMQGLLATVQSTFGAENLSAMVEDLQQAKHILKEKQEC